MPDSERLAEAVAAGDLDELLRLADAFCDDQAWDALADLRARCIRAHEETGRQLWPAAAHAEYRLALEAPGPWAASVLVEGAGRFALGPLPEVAASTHPWADLAPHVPPGPAAVIAAHERVVRGEDLTGVELPGPPVLDLPLRLEPWEPDYSLAEYRAHEADFPGPSLPPVADVSLPVAATVVDDPVAVDALVGAVAAWTAGSEGHAHGVAVEGDAPAAIRALGATGARATDLTMESALALIGWAGASGGVHGRRPGAAAGRMSAWWVVAALAELDEAWPPPPDVVGGAADRLHWLTWDHGSPSPGWALRLAVEDRAQGRAWAIDAADAG